MSTKKKKSSTPQLRLRVFAGPNGSGKSTIIQSVREQEVNGRPIDFGYYINADDIARAISLGKFSFNSFDIMVTKSAILEFASTSGLLNDKFTLENLKAAFSIRTNILNVKKKAFAEQIAQLIARFLREQMLLHKKRFSFETVFSHESNIDIMRRAAEMGYKVYLYFVSTSSALVNKYRVELRVKEGGHGVPAEKIASRYYRSLDLLYDAMEVSYHAYVFDNSVDGEPYRLLYEQKVTGKSVSVVEYDKKDWPEWFKEYFIFKKKASTKPPKKK